MPFCPECGFNIPDGVVFCTRCGAAAGTTPGTSPTQSVWGGGLTPNVAAVLCYLIGLITGTVFLVLEPYRNDRFVRFHAFQSILYSVADLVVWVVYSRLFLFGLFTYTFGFLWSVLSLIWTLISLAAFLFWLFLMYKAYNKERFMIPLIGEIAAKQAG